MVKLQASLGIARDACDQAYLVTFFAVAGIACVGAAVVAWLVRKPADEAHERPAAVAPSASSVGA